MAETSVTGLVAAEREQIRCAREILCLCRAANIAARELHDRATANNAIALQKYAELDQQFALLISRLGSGQPKCSYQRGPLLRVLTRVDQAEAFANEVLAADLGANVDSLAERLTKLIEDIGFNVAEALERERMAMSVD
jgi:hypothetical protein